MRNVCRRSWRNFDCRNNRLAELALQQDGFFQDVEQAAERWGRRRVGVFIGTSTAGILQTELAYRARDPISGALPPSFEYGPTHNSFSVADYVRRRCRLEGPAVAVSCACASSAKVFGSARRMIEAGFIDAALVGGTDSLCLTTLVRLSLPAAILAHALPPVRCGARRHFHRRGGGIRTSRARAARRERGCRPAAGRRRIQRCLPHVGAPSRRPRRAARNAGRPRRRRPRARQTSITSICTAPEHPATIDPKARRSTGIFGGATPCSSTKGATGHTLGAAGALEAVISALAITHGLMPGGVQHPARSIPISRHTISTRTAGPRSRGYSPIHLVSAGQTAA